MSASNGGSGRRASSASTETAVGAGVGAGTGVHAVYRRMLAQRAALSNPSSVPAWTRLGALGATAGAAPGSLGQGVSSGIRAIHTVMGNAMQARIGDVFGSAPIRAMMSASAGTWRAPSATNWALSLGEHTYWGAQMRGRSSTVAGVAHPPASGVGARVGGVFGTAFRPTLRATFQAVAASNPRFFPIVAAVGAVTGHAAVGAGAGSALGRARRGST